MPTQKHIALQTLLLILNLHEQEQTYYWSRTNPTKRVRITGKYGTKDGVLLCRTIKKMELIQYRRYTCKCGLLYTFSRRSMLFNQCQQRGWSMWPPQGDDQEPHWQGVTTHSLITEVKQLWAWLVHGWVTIWDTLVVAKMWLMPAVFC